MRHTQATHCDSALGGTSLYCVQSGCLVCVTHFHPAAAQGVLANSTHVCGWKLRLAAAGAVRRRLWVLYNMQWRPGVDARCKEQCKHNVCGRLRWAPNVCDLMVSMCAWCLRKATLRLGYPLLLCPWDWW